MILLGIHGLQEAFRSLPSNKISPCITDSEAVDVLPSLKEKEVIELEKNLRRISITFIDNKDSKDRTTEIDENHDEPLKLEITSYTSEFDQSVSGNHSLVSVKSTPKGTTGQDSCVPILIRAKVDNANIPNVKSCLHLFRCQAEFRNQLLAFLIGTIQGLTSAEGALGVLPSIQLQNGTLASIYIFCFCVSSTLAMW
eukprot:CAMPEP_0172490550 /NCGR_PEP_ID=MMETSP1066-20121228/21022_1 /TAXON_ID=671091 /ORGANISM="Coscinodiscus wailesii, Strain CCMP2513" /LENGTH=196 /DNA_ID=CAMNT_0013259075 /DNA_START=57 /DNA_END=644 /DNA_ORIENTATION=+